MFDTLTKLCENKEPRLLQEWGTPTQPFGEQNQAHLYLLPFRSSLSRHNRSNTGMGVHRAPHTDFVCLCKLPGAHCVSKCSRRSQRRDFHMFWNYHTNETDLCVWKVGIFRIFYQMGKVKNKRNMNIIHNGEFELSIQHNLERPPSPRRGENP